MKQELLTPLQHACDIITQWFVNPNKGFLQIFKMKKKNQQKNMDTGIELPLKANLFDSISLFSYFARLGSLSLK